jgi:dihydrofolate reductase
MRPVRYNVAASLDGFIAGPDGEIDWIPMDPAVDFAAIFARVDTVLMGRRTFEQVVRGPALPWAPGTRVYVFSRTLSAAEHPEVTIVGEDPLSVVADLRAENGADEIWLFGGGELFRSLLAAGQVDRVEITVVPVLLGGGVPLLPGNGHRTRLQLLDTRIYPGSGMVTLSYTVLPTA